MNQNYTDITIILDSSGSMQSVAKDTIGGFNTFLTEQQKLDGKASLSLVQFDSQVKVTYDAKNLKDIPELDSRSYNPNGYTALLDAIGTSIQAAGLRFSAMAEVDRPGKVIFVIMTDGEENSSREYTLDQINEMIKHQTEAYKWDFLFIGANQDAISAGSSLGIAPTRSMNYSANGLSTKAVFSSISSSMVNYRDGSLASCDTFFSDADRAAAVSK